MKLKSFVMSLNLISVFIKGCRLKDNSYAQILSQLFGEHNLNNYSVNIVIKIMLSE